MKKSIFLTIFSLFTLGSIFGQSTTTTIALTPAQDTSCAGSSIVLQYQINNTSGGPLTGCCKIEFGNMGSPTILGSTSSFTIPVGTTPVNSISGVLPVLSDGLYNIRVKFYSTCATSAGGTLPSTPYKVFVLNAPSPTITASGSTAICPSASVTLTATDIEPGVTYSWTPGGATTSSISVSSPATYSVTTTNICGSSTSSGVTVTNLPLPVANNISALGSTTFCQGYSVILESTPSGYTDVWSDGVTTESNTVTVSGTYYIVSTNSCGSDTSNSIVVTVNPNPTAPVITQVGTDTLVSSYTYGNMWSTSDTTNYIVPNASGNYEVVYTDANGCSATSSIFSFIYLSTGVLEQSNVASKFYPVPANDNLNIELSNVDENSSVTVNIYSVDGKLIMTNNVQLEMGKTRLNVTDLQNGMYIVEVASQSWKSTKSISVFR